MLKIVPVCLKYLLKDFDLMEVHIIVYVTIQCQNFVFFFVFCLSWQSQAQPKQSKSMSSVTLITSLVNKIQTQKVHETGQNCTFSSKVRVLHFTATLLMCQLKLLYVSEIDKNALFLCVCTSDVFLSLLYTSYHF